MKSALSRGASRRGSCRRCGGRKIGVNARMASSCAPVSSGVVGSCPRMAISPYAAACSSTKFFRLHEHAAGPQQGSKTRPLYGSRHGDEQLHDALRSVELAAALAFGAGESFQKVFHRRARERLGVRFRFVEADVADDVHESAELDFVEAGAGVIAREARL